MKHVTFVPYIGLSSSKLNPTTSQISIYAQEVLIIFPCSSNLLFCGYEGNFENFLPGIHVADPVQP